VGFALGNGLATEAGFTELMTFDQLAVAMKVRQL
jgi:hypothetical protein